MRAGCLRHRTCSCGYRLRTPVQIGSCDRLDGHDIARLLPAPFKDDCGNYQDAPGVTPWMAVVHIER